jgi:hypothetical protein
MVEESQNGGRASCDAGPVGNRKRAKLRSHQKCENKSNVRKNATGQILVARWIKLSSPSRHVENVALHLANAGARSVSATAAAASGVSGSSIRENAKLGNAGRAEEIRKRSIVAGLDPDPRAQSLDERRPRPETGGRKSAGRPRRAAARCPHSPGSGRETRAAIRLYPTQRRGSTEAIAGAQCSRKRCSRKVSRSE